MRTVPFATLKDYCLLGVEMGVIKSLLFLASICAACSPASKNRDNRQSGSANATTNLYSCTAKQASEEVVCREYTAGEGQAESLSGVCKQAFGIALEGIWKPDGCSAAVKNFSKCVLTGQEGTPGYTEYKGQSEVDCTSKGGKFTAATTSVAVTPSGPSTSPAPSVDTTKLRSCTGVVDAAELACFQFLADDMTAEKMKLNSVCKKELTSVALLWRDTACSELTQQYNKCVVPPKAGTPELSKFGNVTKAECESDGGTFIAGTQAPKLAPESIKTYSCSETFEGKDSGCYEYRIWDLYASELARDCVTDPNSRMVSVWSGAACGDSFKTYSKCRFSQIEGVSVEIFGVFSSESECVSQEGAFTSGLLPTTKIEKPYSCTVSVNAKEILCTEYSLNDILADALKSTCVTGSNPATTYTWSPVSCSATAKTFNKCIRPDNKESDGSTSIGYISYDFYSTSTDCTSNGGTFTPGSAVPPANAP